MQMAYDSQLILWNLSVSYLKFVHTSGGIAFMLLQNSLHQRLGRMNLFIIYSFNFSVY